MKLPGFVFLTFLAFISVWGFRMYQESLKERKEHPTISDYATRPDQFLENAYRDLKKHYFKTVLHDIDKAIESMRLIEMDLDKISEDALELAIKDLENIEMEIEKNIIDQEHINHAFTKAMNSLAYAQLRVSETLVEKGEEEHAKQALQFAIEHLQNATKFSDLYELEIEKHIYNSIDSLIENNILDKEALNATVDALLLEMDTTILTGVSLIKTK
ncbi:MAG: hypothetical protein OEY56_05890 [Cyclobacteriaceae bacterium]|nr:hypothetical protein [Cyclobacteriaceae bacterium]